MPPVARLRRLADLSLATTAVTDAGLAPLALLPALERITLYRTGITAAGLLLLQQARPGISIGQ